MLLDYPLRLQNPQMYYTWGSRYELQRLFNIPCKEKKPLAEVWMGAYPKASSVITLADGSKLPLNQLIEKNPVQITGKENGQLPFLFKLLSASKPLSLQVHPDKMQANEGYNRENMEDIPLDDTERNYKDNNHKPELVYALTPFKAMCGFRPAYEINYHLNLLINEGVDIPLYLSDIRDASEELRLIFVWMLSMTTEEKNHLIKQIIRLAKYHTGEPAFDTVQTLYQHYPKDSAIIAPFWLNLVDLKPGEALFLDTGCPHAYLHGTGMEIMACSDNVLRGGLTSKHIDLSELCKIIQFTSKEISTLTPEKICNGSMEVFHIPVRDFSLIFLTVDKQWHCQAGAVHIAFCMKGEITFTGSDISVTLTAGESCLLPAACAADITGHGKLALAGDGEQNPSGFFQVL